MTQAQDQSPGRWLAQLAGELSATRTLPSETGDRFSGPCYGLVRASTGTLPTDRQFQGQQNQTSIGLYHMGTRWYDPAIGLWTQPDTLVPNPADPLALNRCKG